MTGVLDHYLVDPEISLCRLRSSGDAACRLQTQPHCRDRHRDGG
jgi:hypothetical protein